MCGQRWSICAFAIGTFRQVAVGSAVRAVADLMKPGTMADGGTRASNVCRLPVFSWERAGFPDYFAAVVDLSWGWGQVLDTEKVGWRAAMAQ
jgi:hypothetical protein